MPAGSCRLRQLLHIRRGRGGAHVLLSPPLPQHPPGGDAEWASSESQDHLHPVDLTHLSSFWGFGEDGAGKTSLIGKLQGIEEYKKGRGMEYLYLNVHDEDRDDQTRCNVWILDGDLYHKGLLKFAMEANSLKDTLVMLVIDMSRPWTALDSLQKWASVVREHIDKLKIPPEEMKEMEQKLVRDFQEYIEPGEDFPASPQRRNTSIQEDKDDSVILPLGADTLTCNLGIPVVVVCTKCDAISVLEKEHDYRDEHFDFIQSHIRRFCLQYGAALIYTSVKENKNIDLVYRYIVQKLYGFPFNVSAAVVEKDAVFIPAGWDNDKKIGILHENFQTLKADDSFEDIITKPPVRKFVHEKEIIAEDDQVFLMKQQSLLAKQPPTAAGRPVDASPRVPGGSPRTPNRSVTSNVASVTPIPTGSKKIDPNMKAGATSEGVLANFFNSLLSKKTGSPGGPGVGGGSPGGGGSGGGGSNLPPSAKKSGQKPVLTDVQAELDRISRKPEMVSPTTPTSPTEGEAS
ncbi:cytoplasmic dynein 1 light intermediate chain 1 isoform X2 [Gopherus evgoodei]|uniref:Dynein light intermediate chain n=1 Tax=Gopherus evgoodei TaxID=1825980 RepID=A0A8C4YSQ6_9SAUR|nr:cytoplasmic dynein 1 light intermediate chain 1 isoform X2 [Gopherus evgoodei]